MPSTKNTMDQSGVPGIDIENMVVDLLKTYRGKKRKIEQLRFELENIPKLSDSEIIDSMALGSSVSDGGFIGGNHISDKTMMIALKYREAGEQLVSDSVRQIAQELSAMEEEINRLEHYLSLLPENLSEIIRLFFFEGVQNACISERLGISLPTVVNRKKAAVRELTTMYRYLYDTRDQS